MGLSGNQEGASDTTVQKRVEFKFPLLILRTKKFSSLFDYLGSLRVSRYASWIALFLTPLVAGLGLFLIVNSLFNLFSNPAVGQVVRELGPGAVLLLPGINPVLPVVYGWLAIVCAIAIHEGAHGVVARSSGLTVKSSGLIFLLFIPIGAFVDVDEEQLKKAKPRASLKVMAAGVGGNVTVAVICLIGLLLIVGGLAPVIDGGVYVSNVEQGMPAQSAGLLPNDIFVSLDNVRINSTEDLRAVLDNKTLGDIVEVTVARGDGWQDRFSTVANLTVSGNRTVLGVSVGDLMVKERLTNYQNLSLDRLSVYLVPPALASGFIPFSDSLAVFYTHWLGPQWQVYANILFWVWFVNFNVALFNALPIYPLDGGRLFNIVLQKIAKGRLSERVVSGITLAVTALCVTVILLVTIAPFVL